VRGSRPKDEGPRALVDSTARITTLRRASPALFPVRCGTKAPEIGTPWTVTRDSRLPMIGKHGHFRNSGLAESQPAGQPMACRCKYHDLS